MRACCSASRQANPIYITESLLIFDTLPLRAAHLGYNAFTPFLTHTAGVASPAATFGIQMTVERVEAQRKLALRVVWELQTTAGNDLAKGLKQTRLEQVEHALKELRSCADDHRSSNQQKKVAMQAIAEVLTALSRNIDTLSTEASAIVKGMC
jgi:hypothetical protein